MRLSWWGQVAISSVLMLACGDSPTIQQGDFDLPPYEGGGAGPRSAAEPERFNFSDCITGDIPSAVAVPAVGTKAKYYVPDGQKVQFTHKRIESSSELKDLLKTAAGFSSKAFIRGESKLIIQDDWTVSNNERYYYYKITVENPAVVMKNIRLTDDAYHLLKHKGRTAFTARCGQHAKIGYKSGGTLSQVIRMSKKQQDAGASIDSLIQASGLKFGGGGQISAVDGTAMDELNVEVFTQWQGGFGAHAYTRLSQLRTMSEQWPKTVAEHGVVTEIITRPFHDLIKHLADPFEDLLTTEMMWFQAELARLNRMKGNIIALEQARASTSAGELKQLEDLILALAQQIRTCERTTQIHRCQDMSLLFKAKNFVISTTMESPWCGEKLLPAPPPAADEVCEHQMVEQWRTQRDVSCPAEAYKQGILFQDVVSFKSRPKAKDLKQQFDKICFADGVMKSIEFKDSHTVDRHYRLCYPNSERCLFDKKVARIYYNYVFTCRGSDPQFGVLRYQFCPVKEHVITQVCTPGVPTAVAAAHQKQYRRCLVPLDYEIPASTTSSPTISTRAQHDVMGVNIDGGLDHAVVQE